MLPYHRARFAAISFALAAFNKVCIALQVSDYDRSYGAIDISDAQKLPENVDILTLFPGQDYLDLEPKKVVAAVERMLVALNPVTVFTPAPAFAEGAGALHYKALHECRLILMDDAWQATARRGWLNHCVKHALYAMMDGAFLPAPLHGEYFSTLNIPSERHRYPVDVIGTYLPKQCHGVKMPIKEENPYLLFVGRCLPRKRLDVLLKALTAPELSRLNLVVIGDGKASRIWRQLAEGLGIGDRVLWLGSLPNDQARFWMNNALALVVPSNFEQWGLVVNEGWQAGIPVLGSNSVGSLRASYPSEWNWMMPPPGDLSSWQSALTRLLNMPASERSELIAGIKQLADHYSLSAHVDAAIQLANLPIRHKPCAVIGLMALVWNGRVAVY
jgi:glycosyltransferase involved in cell wall biosynthesis